MKIVLDLEIDEQDSKKFLDVSSLHNLSTNEFVQNLLKNELENVVYFENGFKYDKQKKALLNTNNNYIELTNLETQFIELLITNPNNYFTTDIIIENVIAKKPMSIYTLRNVIKKIREKTFPELITSKHNSGYKINALVF